MTNNPDHGISGNFSWAIGHTTGDFIFICGQDDVWMPDKVQKVVDVFIDYPFAEFVCHNLCCVDQNGDLLSEQKINSIFLRHEMYTGEVIKANRMDYLSAAISSVLISGPAACISKSLAQKCLPIPTKVPEDWWLQFCAVADDCAYYIHLTLTKYRIHDSSTHSAGMSFCKHLRRTVQTIKSANNRSDMLFNFSNNASRYLEATLKDEEIPDTANWTLKRVKDIGSKVFEAQNSGRIKGTYLLVKLYFTDVRYKRIGLKNFLTQLAHIIIYGKDSRETLFEL